MMEYTQLMLVLDKCYDGRMMITVVWDNGCVFTSDENTGSFETNNPVDMDDKEYVEYYGCAVHILKIIHLPKDAWFDPEFGEMEEGKWMELSTRNEPLRIEAQDGSVLWERR